MMERVLGPIPQSMIKRAEYVDSSVLIFMILKCFRESGIPSVEGVPAIRFRFTAIA